MGPVSTQAVLDALRALQAKIQRLENDRNRALDEAAALKAKLEARHETEAARLDEARRSAARAEERCRDLEVRGVRSDAALAETTAALAAAKEDYQQSELRCQALMDAMAKKRQVAVRVPQPKKKVVKKKAK